MSDLGQTTAYKARDFKEELEHRFTYHAPDEIRRSLHNSVTVALLEVAKAIHDLTPQGRGQSLALTKLEEARMWANQAIATADPFMIDQIPTVASARKAERREGF